MDGYNYSLNDFLAYVMIYAANADFVITKDEEDHIKRAVGDYSYISMLDLFESHNDLETMEFIQEMKKEFLVDNSEESLLRIVKEVFMVDGHFAACEKALFEALKHLN